MRRISIALWTFRISRPIARLGVLAVLALSLVLAISPSSLAQFELPAAFTGTNEANPPSEVIRLGSIEVAPVRSPITGDILFRVAAPTIYDRDKEGVDLSQAVERRAEEVNARLKRATVHRQAPMMDLSSLTVEAGKLNGVNVITTKDANYTQPLVLVSVTQIDANYQGVPIEDLIESWSHILEEELRTSIEMLSPDQIAKDFVRAATTLLRLIGLTVVFVLVKRWVKRYHNQLRRRKQALRNPETPEVLVDPQQANPDIEPEDQAAQQRHHFLQGFKQILSLDRQLSFLSFIQWLLFWLIILMWYWGLYDLFRQVPILEQYSGSLLGKPIELLAIWFFAGLAIRFVRRLIDRLTTEHEGVDLLDFLTYGDAQRRQLRASTIGGAAKGLATILILVIGVLLALGVLGLPTGSVVAIGGIFGLAISFGSQNLVKDLVNGFLILAEDQFAIGDVIDTGSAAGLVENLNLRVTQLRSSDGELVTIPNSAITQVKNLTRSWSRVNFSIDVAYQTDPKKALAVLQDVAQRFYEDHKWHDTMLAPPDVLGIDRVTHSGMTITIWIQTAPAQQWAVGREFRFRVRQALAEQGITIGTPTYALTSELDDSNQRYAKIKAGELRQANP